MITIRSEPLGSAVAGSVVTASHFGVNFLFDRDRFATGSTAGPSRTYSDALDALGATTIRYPGGTVTERLFDLANPNGTAQYYTFGDATDMFDPDGAGPVQPSTLGLWDMLEAAADAGVPLTFVMPTIRFAGNKEDANGNRYEAVDVGLVRGFVTNLLERALALGVPIQAIELGNEWWVDNAATFGRNLTAVEYGRIASKLAAVTQGAIDDFIAKNDLPGVWQEPEILVQSGPGGRQEMVLPTGEAAPAGYDGPLISATELIFREFNQIAEQRALDGLLTHRYLSGSYVDGWAYRPFDTFEKLAAKNDNFGDLTRYVTEWNVSAKNEAATGLLQVGRLVSLFGEMLDAGVDHANIWSVQQGNDTRLTLNSGAAGEVWNGLSLAGEAFRMMSESLIGLRHVNIADTTSLGLEAFSNKSKVVLFVSNETGARQIQTLDVSSVVASYSHVWGTVLGALGNPLDGDAQPVIENLTAATLKTDNGIQITLDPYETIRLEFSIGRQGVDISGYTDADALAGSSYGDRIEGGADRDTLTGGGGNDTLIGGAGADRLIGGAGLDTADYSTSTRGILADLALPGANKGDAWGDAFSGIENLTGGSANDVLRGDASANRLNGGLGSDQLSGRTGNDALVGEAGNDTLMGNAGTDSLSGGSGNDRLLGGSGRDRLSGSSGADWLDGGSGNDTLSGGSGADHFVFAPLGGADVVTDFGSGDAIDLGGHAFTRLSQAMRYASQAGDDVVFDFAGAHSLTIRDATLAAVADGLLI